MKKLRWTTTSEYVDKDTGEVLTAQQVKETHIIIKKRIKKETYEEYIKESNGSQTLTKFGRIRVTNECTRTGKQIRIW